MNLCTIAYFRLRLRITDAGTVEERITETMHDMPVEFARRFRHDHPDQGIVIMMQEERPANRRPAGHEHRDHSDSYRAGRSPRASGAAPATSLGALITEEVAGLSAATR